MAGSDSAGEFREDGLLPRTPTEALEPTIDFGPPAVSRVHDDLPFNGAPLLTLPAEILKPVRPQPTGLLVPELPDGSGKRTLRLALGVVEPVKRVVPVETKDHCGPMGGVEQVDERPEQASVLGRGEEVEEALRRDGR